MIRLITKNMEKTIFKFKHVDVTYNGKKIGIASKDGANINILIEDDKEIARAIRNDNNVSFSLEVKHAKV